MSALTVQADRQTPLLILLVVIGLLGLGTVMVYSATAGLSEDRFESSHFYLKRWSLRLFASLVAMYLVSRVDYRTWGQAAPYLLGLGFLGLVSVLGLKLLGIGKIRGAYRWIPIPGGTFQPADLMRLALVVYLARSLSRRQGLIRDFGRGFLPYAAIVGSAMGLIALQPDLSTALAIGLVCGLMFYIAGVRLWHLLGTGLVMVPPLYTIIFVFGYRKDRILDFLSPSHDVQGAGYQVTQSLVALGSGGLTGAGLGQSLQKYSFLPEPHTDFVFSILGEELGLVGTLGLLLLFLAFARLGLRIARSASDLQGFLLASGITCMVLAYALVNMGVCTGLLPTTGLPLPFISYGGSSLFLTLVAAGILINVGRRVASDPGALPRPDEAWRLRPLPQPVRVGGGGR